MPDNTENLQKYRDNLDSIDNSIQALIIKRALYVHKIAMSKSTTFPLSIRPNREADIMHRLHNNHSGDFPFTALHRMWAEMINAFTLLQSNYTIALYTPSHSTDTITPFHYWDIARNHFGSHVSITPYTSIQEVIHQAETVPNTIAIAPASGLFSLRKTRVIAQLPYIVQPNALTLYAVAQLPEQQSTHTITLYIGNNLPPEATFITKQGNSILYSVDGFYTDGIGAIPAPMII